VREYPQDGESLSVLLNENAWQTTPDTAWDEQAS
jgi:hypothetical protein